uniref:Transmembrane protein n=1 Tax=Romanomermis culicivorax TaxID=13658 RepID=A0A915I344_ROMCU
MITLLYGPRGHGDTNNDDNNNKIIKRMIRRRLLFHLRTNTTKTLPASTLVLHKNATRSNGVPYLFMIILRAISDPLVQLGFGYSHWAPICKWENR